MQATVIKQYSYSKLERNEKEEIKIIEMQDTEKVELLIIFFCFGFVLGFFGTKGSENYIFWTLINICIVIQFFMLFV